MRVIELSGEEKPNDARSSSDISSTVRAETTFNGDVEITRSTKNSRNVLTVIPKDKRAEVAKFLLEAE